MFDLGFLAWIDPAISGTGGLLYSTYVGGTNDTEVKSLAIDSAGKTVAVAGYTNALDNLVSPSAFQPTYGGSQDAFIARFDLTQVSGPLITGYANAWPASPRMRAAHSLLA